MSLKIITDSTCDLDLQELGKLGVSRVPLNVHFKGKSLLDWEELTPADIIRGVADGEDLPTTSQPSPEAFAEKYREAIADGASEILVITISSELSGTFQSAVIAAQDSEVPVEVFDSRAASHGIAHVVRRAAALRDEGMGIAEMLPALERVRDTNLPFITVGGLEFLQKGGRLGRAQAVIGGLLNIKPILSIRDGKISVEGRARGRKKSVQEVVKLAKEHAESQDGKLFVTFLHVQDPAAAQELKDAFDAAGIPYDFGGIYEIGTVIAAHVGPGTRAAYVYTQDA